MSSKSSELKVQSSKLVEKAISLNHSDFTIIQLCPAQAPLHLRQTTLNSELEPK
jgi:hypothetical protein